jgi:hypothetical protein
MTTTLVVPAQPHSALELLFGPAGDGASPPAVLPAEVSESLARALAGIPAAAREAAIGKVRDAAAGMLDMDVIDLLVSGWRQYHDLTSAARRTLAEPGSSEMVSLITHRVTASQQPSIRVLVDGRPVATIRLSVALIFDVTALLAEISAGLLTGVRAGRCEITATLAIDGTEVASSQARLDLPGAIPVTPGIRLLADQDHQVGGQSHKAAQPQQPVC